MYLSRNLAINFKFRFVLAETLEALAKASNIVDIYKFFQRKIAIYTLIRLNKF